MHTEKYQEARIDRIMAQIVEQGKAMAAQSGCKQIASFLGKRGVKFCTVARVPNNERSNEGQFLLQRTASL